MKIQNVFPIVGIIPSLNPDKKLFEVVSQLFVEGFTDVIVVDDGSDDKHKDIFYKLENLKGCTVLHHKENFGKGRGLKTAFAYYLKNFNQNEYFGVVTADADGQHLPVDIYNTAKAVIRNGKDEPFLALGTRDFDEEIVPFKSRKGNKITTTVFKLLYGKLINDTQTGLRGISNSFIPECLSMKGERFEYEINMLIVAARKKYKIEEVVIKTVYFNSNRETHFNPLKDSLRIYRVMFMSFILFSCSGLISVIVDQGLFALFVHYIFSDFIYSVAIPLSSLIARLCSSFVNYSLNRKFVFSSGKIKFKNLIRYYILCLVQICISALTVTIIYSLVHINSSFIKLIVDGLLFLISYRIQQSWVFPIEIESEDK